MSEIIKNQKDIEGFLELSEDELLIEIGKSIKSGRIGIRMPSSEEFRLAAIYWIREKRVICKV